MHELEQYIMSGDGRCGITKDQLRHMGVRAAAKYISEKEPLNETISGLSKEADLNHEQVKRVVEFANNATFGHLFKSGFGKNITFPMADSAAVMQAVSSGMEKAASPRVVLPKRRYIPGQESVDLETIFSDGLELEKVAEVAGLSSAELSQKTKEFIDLNQEVQSLSSDKVILGDHFIEKLAALKLACREACSNGNTGTVVGAAIESANPSVSLREVISVELGDLVFFGGLEKIANMGMALMSDNQVTGLTQDLEQVSQKLTGTQAAIDSANMAMRNLLTVLRGPDPGGSANQVFAGRPSSAMPAPQPESNPPGAGGPQEGGPAVGAELPPGGAAA